MEAIWRAMEEFSATHADLLFEGLDLLFQLEDPGRVLLDHVADQASIGSEVGTALPSLDGIGEPI